MTPLSLKDALKSAWAAFTKHAGTLVSITFVFLVLNMLLSSADRNHAYGSLAGIASAIVSFLAAYALIRLSLTAARGGTPVWRDALRVEWLEFCWYAVASILVCIINGVGFLLLVIPGFFLITRLALFNFALLDEGLTPIDSIKRSWALTQGNFWKMFLAGVIIVAMNAVGALLLGIGILVSMPLSFLFSAYIYEKLRDASVPAVSEPAA